MAVNQRIRGDVARLEQPVPPGQPRLYWDGKAKAWVHDPRAAMLVVPDPDSPGLFLAQIPDADIDPAKWPDKPYFLQVYDSASPLKDEFLATIQVCMVGGDDGGNGFPSVTLPLKGLAVNGVSFDGVTLTVYGARLAGLPAPIAPKP